MGEQRGRAARRAIAVFAACILLVVMGMAVSRAVSGAVNGSGDDWRLVLVNEDNHVPFGWQVELTELSNGERIDSRVYPDLQEMFDAARAACIA